MFTISSMTTEYLESPLGLETQTVRFGWKIESRQRDWLQQSCRIRVASVKKGLDTPDMWDSGVMETETANELVYAGAPLQPCTPYYWRVDVVSAAGERSSRDGTFEMGLLDENFTAQWIGRKNPRSGWGVYFRKAFAVNKKIIRARAYFSGLGIGELYLNGERVGDALLEPAQTDYEKRVLYTAYDVTEQLRGGENAVGVMLGDGWYHQNRVWADGSFSYGDCRMLLEIHIWYADGTVDKVLSDESFLCAYSR